MRSLLYCCRPCITKTGRETWDSCGSIEPICIHVWWCEWSLQHRFRHHRLAVVEMCRLCYFCILQALFLSFTDILFTTLLWGWHALQWFLKWSFQYSFEFILFYMVSGILIWAFGLIFRTICVNFWMIEKLCSLTNCISPHLARPHFLHKYLIIEVLDLDVISSFWVCTCADCRFVHVVRRVVLTGFPCLFPFIIIFVHMHLVKCFCIDM